MLKFYSTFMSQLQWFLLNETFTDFCSRLDSVIYEGQRTSNYMTEKKVIMNQTDVTEVRK